MLTSFPQTPSRVALNETFSHGTCLYLNKLQMNCHPHYSRETPSWKFAEIQEIRVQSSFGQCKMKPRPRTGDKMQSEGKIGALVLLIALKEFLPCINKVINITADWG